MQNIRDSRKNVQCWDPLLEVTLDRLSGCVSDVCDADSHGWAARRYSYFPHWTVRNRHGLSDSERKDKQVRIGRPWTASPSRLQCTSQRNADENILTSTQGKEKVCDRYKYRRGKSDHRWNFLCRRSWIRKNQNLQLQNRNGHSGGGSHFPGKCKAKSG